MGSLTSPLRGSRLQPARRFGLAIGLLGHAPTAGDGETLTRRITRKLESRIATGLLFILVGLSSVPFGMMISSDAALRLGVVGAIGVITGLLILVLPSDEMHEWWFEALPIVIATELALGVAAAQPDGGLVTPLFTFLGPTVAFVIVRPRARALHAAYASLAILVPVLLWQGTEATLAASLMALTVTWGLGLFVGLVWNGAERQAELLESLVRADPLTGVGNRRLLDERLTYELRRHGRAGRELGVIVLDLNGFKKINDTIGHSAGDVLLQRVATALGRVLRHQDTVTRPGGDEFCVLLPETGLAETTAIVETLRAAIAQIEADGQPLGAALGAAAFPGDARDAASLLEAADRRQRDDKILSSVMPPLALPAVAPGAPAPPVRVPGLRAAAQSFNEMFLGIGAEEGEGTTLARRITRLPSVRVAVGLVLAHAGVMAAIGAAWWFPDRSGPLWACAVMGLVTALVIQLIPTETMNARWFHLLPPIVALEIAAGVLALGSDAFVCLPEVAFLGAAIAFAIDGPRAQLAHLLAATAILGAAVIAVGTSLVFAAGLCALPVLWWTAGYVSISWRTAEEQAQGLGGLMRRDALTGVGNRRLFAERVDYEIDRHARNGRTFALFVLDLNGFKRINDTLGHGIGDELLRDAANALGLAVRGPDTIVRYGGDEFCVLAPETDPEQAAVMARIMREALARVLAEGEPLTAALGYSTFPEDGITAWELADVADARQRADKPRGRERSVPVR